MNFILNFLPLIFFFGTFQYADRHKDWAAAFANEHLSAVVSGGKVGVDEAPVLLAAIVVIVAMLIQVAYMRLTHRKIHLMLWISVGLIVVLGGATVWLHDAMFIKWKPTIAYWVTAAVLWGSRAFFKKNLLADMLGGEIQLAPEIWQRLNLIWVGFFVFMGLLNLYVAYNYSTSAWASFKVFGATGLMIAFTLGQGFYLSRHMQIEDAPPSRP